MSVWELRGVARVSARAVKRVRRGHPWIYRSDIDELPPGGAGLENVETVEANAFDLLRSFRDERFDTIVLDPPAFASGKHTVRKALRAYKEINLRALQLLAPGGVLVTCSCSGRVTPEDFEATLAVAARDAHRDLRILERRGAGPDHPARVGMPESEYLKCLVCAVV